MRHGLSFYLTLFILAYRIKKMKIQEVNVKDIIAKLKSLLFDNKHIVFAYLHGSAVSQDDFQDIDIAVYLTNQATRSDLVDFEISLSLQLEKQLRIPIDIKTLNFAPLSFRYHASKGTLIFSRDEDVREEFLCRTWSDYFDFKPVAQLFLREAVVA